MKKNIPFQAILIAIVQWVSNCPISAQSEWFSPQQWESLVQDSQKNLIIRDTVLYQSFDSDNPLSINYTVSGQYDFFYPQEEGIQGASDSRAIRLYPGSRLTIDTLIYPALKMAEIHIPFAFQHVNKEEDIYFTTYFYSGDTEFDARPYVVKSNDCSRYFREVYAGRQCFYRGRRSAPYRLQIKVTKPTSASDGYYCIDSLFLVGNIEQYSLLQQSGTWHDHSLWSHDYTSLRRSALIDADVRILQKKAAQVVREKRDGRVVVGGEPHDEPFVAAKGRHGVRHAGDLLKHLARLRRKTFARGGKRESPGESLDEVAPGLFLEVLEPDARGRGRDAALRRRSREVSRVGNRKKDAKIGEIDVLHGRLLVRDGRVVLFLGAQEGFKGKYTSVREWRTFG